MGCFFRLKVGLYTAANPTLFTGILPWDFTGKINWAETLYFFRHISSMSGVKPGQRFGKKYFYKWWKRACHNLGVQGVDLYGGTRHSSARALRKFRSHEEIKRATMHSTNKAFERYFQIELEDIKTIYAETKEAAPKLHHNLEQPKKPNILKIRD